MRAFDSIRTVCAGCSLLVAFLSCGLERHPIPAGVYANPSGDETISAGDSQLQFRIRTDPGHPETFVDRTYGYKVFNMDSSSPGPCRRERRRSESADTGGPGMARTSSDTTGGRVKP